MAGAHEPHGGEHAFFERPTAGGIVLFKNLLGRRPSPDIGCPPGFDGEDRKFPFAKTADAIDFILDTPEKTRWPIRNLYWAGLQ